MKITVRQLIDDLKNYDPELPIDFGGLDFYRLKDRGGFVHVEFNQTVYKEDNGDVVLINNKTEDS